MPLPFQRLSYLDGLAVEVDGRSQLLQLVRGDKVVEFAELTEEGRARECENDEGRFSFKFGLTISRRKKALSTVLLRNISHSADKPHQAKIGKKRFEVNTGV